MEKIHNVSGIEFDGVNLRLTVDDETYNVDLTLQSKKLSESPIEVKRNYKLSPSGYGIYWPKIDEDLSIDGLIGKNYNIHTRKIV